MEAIDGPGAAPLHVFNSSQARLHERWQRERAAIIGALAGDPPPEEPAGADPFSDGPPVADPPASPLVKRAGRMCQCARWPSIRAKSDGRPVKSLGRCRDRMCPYCAAMRGRRLAERAAELIGKMRAPRHITLSIKSEPAPLTDQVSQLVGWFRELRRSKLWRSKVKSGIFALEVTLNTNGQSPSFGLWHPHIHVVYEGGFIEVGELRDLWSKITHGSFIVNIEAVRDRAAVGQYVGGWTYAPSKSAGREVAANANPTRRLKDESVAAWPAEKIREYAKALHGRRLVGVFGKLHGQKLDPIDQDEDPGSVHVIDVATLRRAADAGLSQAIHATELLARLGGTWARMAGLLPYRAAPVEDWERAKLVQLCREVSAWAMAPAPVAAVDPPEPEPPPRPPPGPELFATGAAYR